MREHDVAFVPFAPLGRGFLTGALPVDSTFGEGDFRRRNPRFQPEALEQNQAIVERVRAVADEVSATPAQVAIAWVLAQGENVDPDPGHEAPALPRGERRRRGRRARRGHARPSSTRCRRPRERATDDATVAAPPRARGRGGGLRRARPDTRSPVTFGDLVAEYAAAHAGAAIADRSARAFVGVRGRDAEKLCSRSSRTTSRRSSPAASCLAFVLTPKGRPVADLRIWREAPDAFVLEAEPELQDELPGDRAPLPARCPRRDRRRPRPARLDQRARSRSSAAPGVLVADGPLGDRRARRAGRHWRRSGASSSRPAARPIGSDAYEIARVEAGVPRFGAEIDASVLPAETGLVEQAVSFTKGCYVGQEPVARLHYRGHPNRHLRRLLSFDGGLPGGARRDRRSATASSGASRASCSRPARGRRSASATSAARSRRARSWTCGGPSAGPRRPGSRLSTPASMVARRP